MLYAEYMYIAYTSLRQQMFAACDRLSKLDAARDHCYVTEYSGPKQITYYIFIIWFIHNKTKKSPYDS